MNASLTNRISTRTGKKRLAFGCLIGFIALAGWPMATAFGPPVDARTLTLDLGDGVTMELVSIPAGEFTMGSKEGEKGRLDNEGPQHRVKVSKPYYIGKHEVTVGQFRRFVAATGYVTDAEKGGTSFEDGKRGANVLQPDGTWAYHEQASWRNPGFEQSDDHPVLLISWNDATSFIDWLSKSTKKNVRFPTEAEWEHAARGQSSTRYWWGDDDDRTGRVANVADLSYKRRFSDSTVMDMDDGFVFTSPVGRFQPNGFGVLDTCGNVWEWCSDWYRENFDAESSAVDPKGSASGTHRVMRGGSWDSGPDSCRSAKRWRGGPAVRSVRVGLRVAADP